jgi:hypothetical protein
LRAGDDTFDSVVDASGPKEFYGGAGNDVLQGGDSSPDRLFGGDGDDSFRCRGGIDVADGGPGHDSFLPWPPGPECEAVISIP